MALVLPRLLAPVFPTTYSSRFLPFTKAYVKHKHLGSPYHTCVHCKGSAPAAPRGARSSVSVTFSGLPLSGPLRIMGLVSLYLDQQPNPPPTHPEARVSRKDRSRFFSLSRFSHSFPWLSMTSGKIIDVLLSLLPVYCYPRHAWLSRIPIAAIARRINGNSLHHVSFRFSCLVRTCSSAAWCVIYLLLSYVRVALFYY